MRVSGVLSVSRAIGDISYKEYISSEPEISSIQISHQDQLLILSTDGLYKSYSNFSPHHVYPVAADLGSIPFGVARGFDEVLFLDQSQVALLRHILHLRRWSFCFGENIFYYGFEFQYVNHAVPFVGPSFAVCHLRFPCAES